MTTPRIDTTHIPKPAIPLMQAIARAGAALAAAIRADQSATGATSGMEREVAHQTPLEHQADALFGDAFKAAGLRWLVSTAQNDVAEIQPDGMYALAIAPLHGASNIDTNLSAGTIFAIFPAEPDAQASFLRPAREIIGAGYVIYGPRCCMMASFGQGTQSYRLNPGTDCFDLDNPGVTLPECAFDFAVNAANYRTWPRPVRADVDDRLAGIDGQHAQNLNMGWIASLVAEAHRILLRGGVFPYPAEGRVGYGHGRLRLLHECVPIAFLIEQAGGRARDGAAPILDSAITSLHCQSPLVFGNAESVERMATYHDLPEAEVSALFGHRGLFRA